MKKFLSLLLAAMMLLSCASAMATHVDDDTTTQWMENVYVGDQTLFSEVGGQNETSATQTTDVWLQVEASGQIDVTIPLVAVFKTDIDGGNETISDSYKIINYSSAPIAVTQVDIEDQNTNVTVNGKDSDMTMVETVNAANYDEYSLTMLPKDRYTTNPWSTAKNVKGDFTAATTNATTLAAKQKYTLTSNGYSQKEAKGLWLVERKGAVNDSNEKLDESYINLTLTTSPLSFVTKQKSNNNGNIENGIKLFTITYTVEIADDAPVGGDIEGYGIGNYAYSYTGATTEGDGE